MVTSNSDSNGCSKKAKYAKISEKQTFLTPWYADTRTLLSWNTRLEICPFSLLPTNGLCYFLWCWPLVNTSHSLFQITDSVLSEVDAADKLDGLRGWVYNGMSTAVIWFYYCISFQINKLSVPVDNFILDILSVFWYCFIGVFSEQFYL